MTIKASHILVIDDNEDILFMMQSMLQIKGYNVSVKDNIKDIEAFITEVSPDIILMDMLLCGADGREICTRLKANASFSNIPVIMISAHSHMETECLQAGANYFLAKPFSMKELYDIVARGIE